MATNKDFKIGRLASKKQLVFFFLIVTKIGALIKEGKSFKRRGVIHSTKYH